MQKTFKIAVLPGDGIGPEVVDESIKVLKAVAKKYSLVFDLSYEDIGAIAIDKTGDPLPSATLKLCLNSDAVLLGAIGDPKYSDPSLKIRPEQGLLKLRKELQLFSNIRPVKAYSKILHLSPIKNVAGSDLVIYRELTGGIYFGKSGREDKNEAHDIMSYKRHEIERMAHQAFKAAKNRRKKLCLVDKANVLESSRFWREIVTEISHEYPEVQLSTLYIDNAAMQIILNPASFDVILTANLFGDILSDEASVITGSLGMLPSASIGEKYSMFEPVHGSYPQAAGKNIANPLATILSVAMMLDHLQLDNAAKDIRSAVENCIDNEILTEDLNKTNPYKCTEVGDAVVRFLA